MRVLYERNHLRLHMRDGKVSQFIFDAHPHIMQTQTLNQNLINNTATSDLQPPSKSQRGVPFDIIYSPSSNGSN